MKGYEYDPPSPHDVTVTAGVPPPDFSLRLDEPVRDVLLLASASSCLV